MSWYKTSRHSLIIPAKIVAVYFVRPLVCLCASVPSIPNLSKKRTDFGGGAGPRVLAYDIGVLYGYVPRNCFTSSKKIIRHGSGFHLKILTYWSMHYYNLYCKILRIIMVAFLRSRGENEWAVAKLLGNYFGDILS